MKNKTDELDALLRFEWNYQTSSVVSFTEIWLGEGDDVSFDGFEMTRACRGESSGKDKDGALCMLVDLNLAKDFMVHERHCSKDVEVLTVSFQPDYLPREFGQCTIIPAYAPGQTLSVHRNESQKVTVG